MQQATREQQAVPLRPPAQPRVGRRRRPTQPRRQLFFLDPSLYLGGSPIPFQRRGPARREYGGLAIDGRQGDDLAPTYDLTVSPIFTTKENAVLTADYRHLLESGRFNLGGSITYATKAGTQSDPNPSGQSFRGNIAGEGDFSLPNHWGWGYDLAVASDDTYLDRYNFSDADVLQNRLFAERIWSRNYAVVQGYGFQGLREDDDQGLIPIALPQVHQLRDEGDRHQRVQVHVEPVEQPTQPRGEAGLLLLWREFGERLGFFDGVHDGGMTRAVQSLTPPHSIRKRISQEGRKR